MKRLVSLMLGGAFFCVVACSSKSGGDPNPNPANQPSQKDQSTVDQGAQSVKTGNCVSCHTQNMAGSTTMIPYPQDPRVELYPPNLTPDMATGVGKWTDDQLVNAIRTGVDFDGLELCPEMQHF